MYKQMQKKPETDFIV